MTGEPSRTRAPELLREYLAERDVLCGRCGYNLRAAEGVQCPECGEVIPRPPAEFVTARRADAATEPTPLPRRRWFRLPVPVLFPIVPGLCVALTCVAVGVGTALGRRVSGPVDPWAGMFLALGAVAIGGAWMWWGTTIRRLERGERRALGIVAALASFALLSVALRAL